MKPYKNLIFDIGNVIVDIDFAVIVAEFQKIATVNFGDLLSLSAQHDIFDRFDRGHVTAANFRQELRKFLKPGISDKEINQAWNSILVHYPPAKIQLLKELKKNYRTYALSNINEIHIESINLVAQKDFGEKDFGSLFHHAYYSNEVGARKPDKEIYEHIIQMENLVPSETFFVDDKLDNIETARALGLQAFHLKERDKLHELLAELKII